MFGASLMLGSARVGVGLRGCGSICDKAGSMSFDLWAGRREERGGSCALSFTESDVDSGQVGTAMDGSVTVEVSDKGRHSDRT